MRVSHLGTMKERLHDQRALIVLDDVNDLEQLDALASETTWFGPGSRIVVITENKELLQQHGIHNVYHVEFLSDEQALMILCQYAFKQSYPRNGFKELAIRVTELCGNLPLGLSSVGSSLLGKNEKEWGTVLRRLNTNLYHKDIDKALRGGFQSLHEDEQSLFLHIATFFNDQDHNILKSMFDVEHGLEILVNRCLIYISSGWKIVMHKLLQQWATNVVRREEHWKRQILIDASEICDVLERAKGTRAVSGISFDISDIDELSINEKAFKRMPNLRFLKVYKSKDDGNEMMHIPEDMEFPRRLRLLQWEKYPNKCLPPRLSLEHLVELDFQDSKLEKLWEGIQPLPNLKRMKVSGSLYLKELPDLSSATNLESLYLHGCKSLTDVPSSTEAPLRACQPVREMPTMFDHRATGSDEYEWDLLLQENFLPDILNQKATILKPDGSLEVDNEILFEFSTTYEEVDIMECGVEFLTDDANGKVSSHESNEFDEPRVKRLKT